MDKHLDRSALTFRQDYFDDPAGWQAVKDLILDIFGVDIELLDSVGGYDRTNLPSAYFDEHGRIVANLSAFAMPLIIGGRRVNAFGWQSGAVRPSHRGRGLFRDLIGRTLARCREAGAEAMVLYTDKPAIYEPYDFVTIPQYSFVGPPPPRLAAAGHGRPLDVTVEADLALAERLLAGRASVSSAFAVADQSRMFLLNALIVEGVRLDYMEDLGAIVAWRHEPGGIFQLLDVVAGEIPPLAELLPRLDARVSSLEVCFPPDRLDWQGEARRDEGPLVFMMRCPDHLLPREPFCLSPMAEF